MDFDHHLEELSSSSQCIPSSDDFRFYYNFTEFRRPIEEIAKRSQSMLNKIGSSEHIWGRGSSFPVDVDDAYEWLVNANDDVLELVDELVDEFEKVMKEYEGENGSVKKKGASQLGDEMNETKPKVSFHVSTLRKPQYHYNIVVNNANRPFEHFLLQKSDDGLRFIHPLVGSLFSVSACVIVSLGFDIFLCFAWV